MSIVLALRRWGKGGQFKVILSHSELKASLDYVRSCLEERKEREENEKKRMNIWILLLDTAIPNWP